MIVEYLIMIIDNWIKKKILINLEDGRDLRKVDYDEILINIILVIIFTTYLYLHIYPWKLQIE